MYCRAKVIMLNSIIPELRGHFANEKLENIQIFQKVIKNTLIYFNATVSTLLNLWVAIYYSIKNLYIAIKFHFKNYWIVVIMILRIILRIQEI